MGWGKFGLTIVGLTMAICANSCSGSVNQEIAKACDNGRIDVSRILNIWEKAGVIRSTRRSADNTIFVEVSTQRWLDAGHDAQVSIAIAAYCRIKTSDGYGKALIQGSSQEELGSVDNGNWWH